MFFPIFDSLFNRMNQMFAETSKVMDETFKQLNKNSVDVKTVDKEDGSSEVQVDLKDFGDKNVKVDVKDGVMTVNAEKRTRGKITGTRKYRSFRYSFAVPNGVTHKLENGKLLVNIPKNNALENKEQKALT